MFLPSRSSLLVPFFIVFAACSSTEPPVFDEASAWNYLVKQCELGPRVPGTEAHRKTIRLIQEELSAGEWEVTLQNFSIEDPYGDGELNLVNIIANINPEAKKRVLLAAHYDTRPRADNESVDSMKVKPILGANDGASGVAVLLELARIVGSKPPTGLGIDITFFDGEDYGKASDLDHYLLGSKYFASRLSYSVGYHPVCGILLDMVGGKDARIYQELNSLRYAPELTRVLFERARELNLEMFVARKGTAIYDDHLPLLRAGIKTVDLIDSTYPFWHTLDDTPENCSRESLRQAGILLVDFLYNFPF